MALWLQKEDLITGVQMKKMMIFTMMVLANFAMADEQANEKLMDEGIQAEVQQTIQQQEIISEEEVSPVQPNTTECVAVIPEVTSIDVAETLAAKGFQVIGTKQAGSKQLLNALIFDKASVVDSGIVSKHVIKSKLQVISVHGDQKSVVAEQELDTVRCNDLESHECVEKIEIEHNSAMAKLAEKANPADCAK